MSSATRLLGFLFVAALMVPLTAHAQSTPLERDNPVVEAIKAKSQPFEREFTRVWVENGTLSDEEIAAAG